MKTNQKTPKYINKNNLKNTKTILGEPLNIQIKKILRKATSKAKDTILGKQIKNKYLKNTK